MSEYTDIMQSKIASENLVKEVKPILGTLETELERIKIKMSDLEQKHLDVSSANLTPLQTRCGHFSNAIILLNKLCEQGNLTEIERAHLEQVITEIQK